MKPIGMELAPGEDDILYFKGQKRMAEQVTLNTHHRRLRRLVHKLRSKTKDPLLVAFLDDATNFLRGGKIESAKKQVQIVRAAVGMVEVDPTTSPIISMG